MAVKKSKTSKKVIKVSQGLRFSKAQALSAIAALVAIGGYFVYQSFAATGAIKVNAPVVGIMSAGANSKYWVATSDGGIFSMGGAPFYGSAAGGALNQPITAVRARPQKDGYWLLGGDGGIFAYGAAPYLNRPANSTVKGFYRSIIPTDTGAGYWVISLGGHILPFGDAVAKSGAASAGFRSINADKTTFNTAFGGLPGLPPGGIVAASSTNTGRGMYLLADNGAVYAYGDALHRGNAAIDYANGARAADIMSYGAGSSGGYLVVGKAGKVFKFGSAPSYGDPSPVSGSITGIAYTPSAAGYWLTGVGGAVFAYGDAQLSGAVIVTSPPTPTPTPTPAPKPPSTPSAPAPTTPSGSVSISTAITTSLSGVTPCSGDVVRNILLLQQCLNKLGATPRLMEDGLIGDLTRTACANILKGYCPYPPVVVDNGQADCRAHSHMSNSRCVADIGYLFCPDSTYQPLAGGYGCLTHQAPGTNGSGVATPRPATQGHLNADITVSRSDTKAYTYYSCVNYTGKSTTKVSGGGYNELAFARDSSLVYYFDVGGSRACPQDLQGNLIYRNYPYHGSGYTITASPGVSIKSVSHFVVCVDAKTGSNNTCSSDPAGFRFKAALR